MFNSLPMRVCGSFVVANQFDDRSACRLFSLPITALLLPCVRRLLCRHPGTPPHQLPRPPPTPTDNANPTVYAVGPARLPRPAPLPLDADGGREPIDAGEVFEHIRHLNDPEHPLTLEQLRVVTLDGVQVDDALGSLEVRFTPTIPHCRWVVWGEGERRSFPRPARQSLTPPTPPPSAWPP